MMTWVLLRAIIRTACLASLWGRGPLLRWGLTFCHLLLLVLSYCDINTDRWLAPALNTGWCTLHAALINSVGHIKNKVKVCLFMLMLFTKRKCYSYLQITFSDKNRKKRIYVKLYTLKGSFRWNISWLMCGEMAFKGCRSQDRILPIGLQITRLTLLSLYVHLLLWYHGLSKDIFF